MLDMITNYFSAFLSFLYQYPLLGIMLVGILFRIYSSLQPMPKDAEGSKVRDVQSIEEWNAHVAAAKVCISFCLPSTYYKFI